MKIDDGSTHVILTPAFESIASHKWRSRHTDINLQSQAYNCASVLLTNAPDGSWEKIWPIFNSNSEFGHRVIECINERYDHCNAVAQVAKRLTESQMADLYIWLVTQYPREEDPSHDGAFSAGIRDRIAYFRDDLYRAIQCKGEVLPSVKRKKRVL